LKNRIPEELSAISTLRGAGSKSHGGASIGFGLAERTGEAVSSVAGAGGVGLLVTDPTLLELGLHGVVADSLAEAGLKVDVFSDVESEPSVECARGVQETVRSKGYDFVVGMGGGSVLDMAKTAALMITNPGDVLQYFTGTDLVADGAPLFLLPTTSGTGSEVSPFIVISDGPDKRFIATPRALATISYVDPLLTASMPPKVTAATGLDALSHGVEGAISMRDPFTEALAAKTVALVLRYLPQAFTDGEDLVARYYMSFASVLGMTAYAQGGGLYAHSISYILTTDRKTPHGIGCGVSLPYTLCYTSEYIGPILDELARSIPDGYHGAKQKPDLPEAIMQLLDRVGVPSSLGALGMDAEFSDIFAEKLAGTYFRAKNPRGMSRDDAAGLYDAMLRGDLAALRR
jgi:alcohol dehydrogenase class IV